MSDIEEPPSKVLKLEMSGVEEHLEPEGDEDNMENGQEEWLSEGVLTDDDYNAGGEQEAMGPTEMLEDSGTVDDDATPSLESSTERLETLDPADTHDWLEHSGNAQHGVTTQSEIKQTPKVNGKTPQGPVQEKDKKEEQDIEDTLNDLDRRNELPEDLDAFLIRKSDGQLVDKKVKVEEPPSKAVLEDDGNDTDDLLRMLGEDDTKLKKKVLVKKTSSSQNDMLSSDDEFTYENTKVKTLKVAKNVLMKKRPASKAVPEVMSDDTTEASSDEATTMKKMFAVAPKKAVAAKSTAKTLAVQAKTADKPVPANSAKIKELAHSTPIKQYVNRNQQSKPVHKVSGPVAPSGMSGVSGASGKTGASGITVRSGAKATDHKPATIKSDVVLKKPDIKPKVEDKLNLKDSKAEHKVVKMDVGRQSPDEDLDNHDEIIDEEEFLEEEEDFELDEEEFGEESDLEEGSGKQRIMKPERMDEEMPTDGDSYTEDGSLYDEMPSSDSEDLDDWFSLDVRAERAGDYLPLLGSKARSLLLEEKRRVTARLGTLRQSLSALTDSGRRQAEQLRRATMTLAELDDMLKAT